MIEIITISNQGAVLNRRAMWLDWNELYRDAQPLTPDTVLTDVIHLLPGVPPLGSAAFDAWLKDWHERHNGPRCNWHDTLSADFDGCNGCPRTCATEY